jgi:hypothetical protein
MERCSGLGTLFLLIDPCFELSVYFGIGFNISKAVIIEHSARLISDSANIDFTGFTEYTLEGIRVSPTQIATVDEQLCCRVCWHDPRSV